MAGKSSSTQPARREVVITRVFDAPRELVFRAWTDPKHLAQWWGPHHFTNPVCEVDVRPGGALRIVMRGPDGTDFPMTGTFREVVVPERLVFMGVARDAKGNALLESLTTVTFAEEAGKTRLTVKASAVGLAPEAPRMLEGMEAGWTQSLERLEGLLSQPQSAASREFVISRAFNAPLERVWKAWTERDRLMQWFGPKGFTMRVATLDLRPGGVFHYCLRPAGGQDMWGKFVFREIVPRERLVWVNSFSDEKGGVTRHPMSPGWPLKMLTTVTFTEAAGRTTVTVRWSALDATDAEHATFDAGHDSMRVGWTGTFEQLDAYLAKG